MYLHLAQPTALAVLLLLSPSPATAADPGMPPAPDGPVVTATSPPPWTERVRITNDGKAMPYKERIRDSVLRIVTPEHSQSLNRSLLARVFGDNRPQYDLRNELPGDQVASLPSPAITLLPSMAKGVIAGYFAHVPDALPAQPTTVQFAADRWVLVHQGHHLRENPAYRLEHHTYIYLWRNDGSIGEVISCSNSGRSNTLDQWQADDYAMVEQSAVLLALECAGKLARALPRFYPPPLETEDLSQYPDGVVPPARIRIFGGSGRGITVLTDAACHDSYASKIEVKRSNARAIGSLFGAAPDNIVIGMPESDSVRNMQSVLLSIPNYEEYEVPGGKPLIVQARIENSDRYYCARTLSAQFVARPGHDYEARMEVSDNMCHLRIHQLHADGSLTLQPVRHSPKQCSRPPAAD